MLEVSAIKDIENDLKLINENAVAKDNRLLTLNRFGDFIQNHSTLKRLSVSSLRFNSFNVQQNQR